MGAAETFNTALSATKTIVSTAVGVMYGPGPKAFVELALGHPAMLTQLAAMGEKNERGELTSTDWATCLKIVTDIGIAVAVIGGAPISVPVLVVWTVVGIGLSIYQNRENIQTFIDDFQTLLDSGAPDIGGDPFTGMPWPGMDVAVNDKTTAARNVVIRRDPLVLDLDGDGLELSAASGNTLFDHNADGIKTGTGWARPDDGFLVRDLDGNGTIDTGRELFGVDTIKSNGALATQGFDALKDLDTNNDGFITSADAAFGELKVWQDTNQDGISQSGELKTLTQLSITSIDQRAGSGLPDALQTSHCRRRLTTRWTPRHCALQFDGEILWFHVLGQ